MATDAEREALSRFAHAFGSPLTAMQSAVRMLALLHPMLPRRTAHSGAARAQLPAAGRHGRAAARRDDGRGNHRAGLSAGRPGRRRAGLCAPVAAEATVTRPTQQALPSDRPDILIVDDDLPVRKMLAAMLSQAGYSVRTAADATTAVDLAASGDPLSSPDLAMPGVDGSRLLPVLKEDPAIKDIPVLVVSALVAGGRIHVPGAAGSISKPVHRDLFLRAVADILTPTTEPAGRRAKILLVDDEEDLRRPWPPASTSRALPSLN